MPIENKRRITHEEYLEMERNAPFKSDYYKGEVFALAGTSFRHNVIANTIAVSLGIQLKPKPCHVLQSDMRVYIPGQDMFTYPDISVVCGKPEFLDETFDTLLNPVIIIEVLSPSTENYDRGLKFSLYRRLESLKEYITIAQDRIEAEHYRKTQTGEWILKEYNHSENILLLESISCSLSLSDIYDKTDLI